MAARSFGPSYFAIITGPVLDDRALSANAKLLYACITSMADRTGYCWAGNKHLADRFGWGERTVSRFIAQLEEAGFIRTMMVVNEETHKLERRIYIGNDAAEGVAKIGNPRQNWRGGVAKTGETTPYIRKEKEKREDKKFSPPPELWERCVAFAGGDCDLESALLGLLESRHVRKNPLATDRALTILLNKLKKESGESHPVMIAMLDKAVEKNWDTVYPLKPDELAACRERERPEQTGGYGWR